MQPAWPHRTGEKISGTTETIKEAVALCEHHGYKIAFATSESYDEATNDHQKDFIRHVYPSVKDDFFDSVYFQHAGKLLGSKRDEYSMKQPMYMNILGRGGMDLEENQFQCSLVFDDEVGNLRDAQRLGLRVAQASPECGGKHCTIGCGIPESALALIPAGTVGDWLPPGPLP